MLVICDPRLGTRGSGIYFLPFGIAACSLAFFATLRAVFDPELISFNSANVVAIWLLTVAAAGFFLMLALGGVRVLLQARHVVQRLEGCESITIKPFLGRQVRTAYEGIMSVESVSPHRPWIPMTLLSRDHPNWKIILRGGHEYLICAEIPNIEERMSAMRRTVHAR